MSGLGAGRVNARRRQLSRSLGPSRTLHTIWLLRRYPPNSGQMAKSEGARSQPSLSPEPVGFGWKSVRATPPRLAYTHAETAVGEQMALFKSSNPEKTVQRDIDAATTNRERISGKLAEAEQAIARHAAAAKQAALTGDDAELDRAEASLRAAVPVGNQTRTYR
jgi:hypothetical protein